MRVAILGCRGIPASHGGFETFAEHLAVYLSSRGHEITVYCQSDAVNSIGEDYWRDIRRVIVPGASSPLGTIAFDWRAARHARSEDGIILTLGYNTAIFSLLYRLTGRTSLMNMDGLEWKRAKWSYLQRLWLRLNEQMGILLSDHLIADHPEIGKHLARYTSEERITVIPYAAEEVTEADPTLVKALGLEPQEYVIVIARAEPDNFLLEIVRGFSQKPRGLKLVILGRYSPDTNSNHRRVMDAAGPEVLFLGSIYEVDLVRALRLFARAYIHGHRVGGTNPSLVESLAAGNPVIAHDNRFTRAVAGEQQEYFTSAEDLSLTLDRVLGDPERLNQMAMTSRSRHGEFFIPATVLTAYETLLERFAPKAQLTPSLETGKGTVAPQNSPKHG
jgi:glycosyltransferase involved in cell wall biosynthesis